MSTDVLSWLGDEYLSLLQTPKRSLPTADSVEDYFKEIRRYPRIDDATTQRLFQAIRDGREAHDKLTTQRKKAEDPELRTCIANAERAKTILLVCNLRLVGPVAYRYQGYGIETMVLIQEGNIGLMEAIETYRLELGAAFSTHATTCIRNKIRNVLFVTTPLVFTDHQLKRVRELKRVYATLEDQGRKRPTAAELAAKLGWPEYLVREILLAVVQGERVSSLEMMTAEGELWQYAEAYLATPSHESAVTSDISYRQAQEWLRTHLVGRLSDKEFHLVEDAFGLHGDSPLGFRQLAEKHGLDIRTVRTLLKTSLRRLRFSIDMETKEVLQAIFAESSAVHLASGPTPVGRPVWTLLPEEITEAILRYIANTGRGFVEYYPVHEYFARIIGIQKEVASKVLLRLDKLGYITRLSLSTSGREKGDAYHRVSITDEGRSFLERM